MVFVLGAYAMTRPEMWPRVFSVAALAVGIGAGLLVTRISRAWIWMVHLECFWLGGLLWRPRCRTRTATTEATGESPLLFSIEGVDGVVATIALGFTALARAALAGRD